VKLLRSRLLHFLAMGALLAALAPRQKDDSIVIDAPRVTAAIEAEQARKGASLTPEEKEATIRALVDEEVLAREAQRVGIGTDDPVVRARSAERMRASYAATLPMPPVDDAEVTAETMRLVARAPERVRLAVWFVARDRADAARVADALADADGGPPKAIDPPPIPDGAWWTEEALARVVGREAARGAFAAELRKTSRALASTWGYYVFVPLERRAADPAELRTEATANVVEKKKAAEVERLVARARKRYRIEVPGAAFVAPSAKGID